MNESEFQSRMRAAKTLQSLSTHPDNEYWSGYQRGCRRNYHGKSFGTDSEHTLHLSLASEERDDSRKFMGVGYNDGLNCKPIADAIKHLEILTT